MFVAEVIKFRSHLFKIYWEPCQKLKIGQVRHTLFGVRASFFLFTILIKGEDQDLRLSIDAVHGPSKDIDMERYLNILLYVVPTSGVIICASGPNWSVLFFICNWQQKML